MKTGRAQVIGWILAMGLLCQTAPIQAQEQTEPYTTISGVVKDKQSKKRLGYVNISVPGTSVGTITNEDGEFSIKILSSLQAKQVEVSHIGYLNDLIPLSGNNLSDYTVWLEPNTTSLAEVIVRAGDPRTIVQEALSKVGNNYTKTGSMLTGFYRETAQKGRRYINISEAIIDIYKTPYPLRDVDRDRVQIYKGRKLLSQKASDTLAIKLQGGPNLSIYVDVVKNPDLLLSSEMLPAYAFRMEESTMLNDRPHYVIRFEPAVILPYVLYQGKLYIDKEKLNISRAEFALCMDDQSKATAAVLRKKPAGLRFKPVEVSYLVTYKEQAGITRLSYIRNEVHFKCDWKKKLFATSYAVVSEMVVTDGRVEQHGIPYRMAFKADQSLSDKVLDFADDNFWGAYNIIEPTESLENAVNKLKKQRR